MKNWLTLGMAMGIIILAGNANAALLDRGVDTLGNHLIYDTDQDITWYDFTQDADTWANQMSWAADLTVTKNGTSYSDWRLPATAAGAWLWSYNGTTTAGYNITTSEMGHLYYTELGNLGAFDTSGNKQPGFGLENLGPFLNLAGSICWSGTAYAASPTAAWIFATGEGLQHTFGTSSEFGALAVHAGDMAGGPPNAVPAPASLLLIGAGLAGLLGLGRGRRSGH